MKGFHVHRGLTKSKIEKGLIEGTHLWYTTHTDSGWFLLEKKVGKDEYGGYSVFEINIPESAITTSLTPNPKKVFKLTRENYKLFTKEYDADPTGFDIEKAKKMFAGIDANDKSLYRTYAFLAINGGPASGVIWRFKDTGISVKCTERVKNTS